MRTPPVPPDHHNSDAPGEAIPKAGGGRRIAVFPLKGARARVQHLGSMVSVDSTAAVVQGALLPKCRWNRNRTRRHERGDRNMWP
jgi:hypothetical protein